MTTDPQTELIAAVIGENIPEDVTAEHVTAAEQEASEAEAAVELLERRVADGSDDTITAETIEQQRGKSRFARLRAAGIARKAERAEMARRLRACDDLRREVEGHVGGAGKEFAKLLADAEKAVAAFVSAVDERNRHVYDWHRRAQALDVKPHSSPLIPPKADAHLATTGHGGDHRSAGVVAGRRRVQMQDPIHFLRVVLSRVTSQTVDPNNAVVTGMSGLDGDPYELLANIDAEVPELPADVKFFRGPNGALLWFDQDRMPEEHILKTLTPVSRKELGR